MPNIVTDTMNLIALPAPGFQCMKLCNVLFSSNMKNCLQWFFLRAKIIKLCDYLYRCRSLSAEGPCRWEYSVCRQTKSHSVAEFLSFGSWLTAECRDMSLAPPPSLSESAADGGLSAGEDLFESALGDDDSGLDGVGTNGDLTESSDRPKTGSDTMEDFSLQVGVL
jgi:hypothetical protein